jgi:hypothetical protein
VTALPDHVDLGPHRYTIDASHEAATLLREDGSNGDSRPDRHLIRLDIDRPHTAVAVTLLHELVHCAWQHTNLRVDHDPDHEERIVTALAPLLLEAVRRNPTLTAYLTA